MDSKTLCLGALMLGDASGYEIKKLFEEGPFNYFHQTSFGSIYPALGKLTNEGLVTCDEHQQDGRPDKKVYSLTDAGRAAFKSALAKAPAPDKIQSEYMYMLFFANMLESEHVRDVYDEYMDGFRRNIEVLEGLSAEGISSPRLFMRGFGKVYYTSALKYMEDNRHMVLPDTKATGTKGGRS
ncbi:MAG: PadR family transcriptional regulator [Alphaproteobacteria bacterium]|jgi:PadR family transcriptional regulator, regulatory protein AphA|nr:PadR family transcriptional regulator [Alphaproteobacteria bacterium]MBT7943290.1 PadR family transcriptional regulator [Alphaproteobacteria bacterium]